MMGLGGGVRDMAAVLAVMSYMKNVDQEDPTVILVCRCVYGAYLLMVLGWYLYVKSVIEKKKDLTKIKVPIPANPFAPAPAEGEPAPPTEQEKSVMEYDYELLNQQRSGVLTGTLILSFLHFKMGSVTPLVLSPITGLLKLVDDPLTKLHILGQPAEGALQRPFKKPGNPLLGMLGMDPNASSEGATAAAATGPARAGEDLAGDEETEEEVIEEIVEEVEEEEEEDNGNVQAEKEDQLPATVPPTQKAEDGESKKDK
uniref:Inorganic phosphate transporter n=1 Tax=Erythrolobus australicus TaxID=1077150 RepID=A0A7S1XIY9_9RHOD